MKFKVGDRVAAYINGQRVLGVLETLNPNNTFEFCADEYSSRRTVHPKQCRRLVKRERRRVSIYFGDKGTVVEGGRQFEVGEEIDFVEVRRRK